MTFLMAGYRLNLDDVRHGILFNFRVVYWGLLEKEHDAQ
jgi:hypothetical protein